VRLFLDTSVLLAASGSASGASREIFHRASANGWVLVSTPYALEEALRNISDLPLPASAEWARLRPALLVMNDVLTLDRPAVFHAAKDRPILFSALAWADVLLTLDRGDFGSLMDNPFYGLLVLRPGVFLQRERSAGRLK
jgi:predicted nucleic acid-binding protein